MEKKTGGIIATIVAVLLCGCPGLCLCLFGAVTAAGQMPWTADLSGYNQYGTVPPAWGLVGLCLALIFIAIPIVVGILTLRNKPEKPASKVEMRRDYLFASLLLCRLAFFNNLSCQVVAAKLRHQVDAVRPCPDLLDQLEGDLHTLPGGFLTGLFHSLTVSFRDRDAWHFVIQESCMPQAVKGKYANQQRNLYHPVSVSIPL